MYIRYFAVLEVQFDRSSYRVNESDGFTVVCLERVGSAVIVPGVTIDMFLVEVSDKHLGMYYKRHSQ